MQSNCQVVNCLLKTYVIDENNTETDTNTVNFNQSDVQNTVEYGNGL